MTITPSSKVLAPAVETVAGTPGTPEAQPDRDALSCPTGGANTSTVTRDHNSGDQNRRAFPRDRQFAFTADRHGRPIAYLSSQSFRWFRIGYEYAKLMVATEQGTRVPYTVVRDGLTVRS